MKSIKTTIALEAKLVRLRDSLAERTQQADKMWKEIQEWPVEMIVVNGQKFKIPARAIKNEQLSRTHDDCMREKGRVEYEIRETESLLSPAKGRPKGRRNERSKPADPTIVAALEDWKNSREPKP